MAREMGIGYEVMLNLHNLGDILVHLDDLPRAYGAIRQSLALCEESGYERLANYNRMFLAFLDGIQGTVDGEKLLAAGHRLRGEQGLHLGRHRRPRAAREPAAPRRAARGRARRVREDARARDRGGAPPRRRRLRHRAAEARADDARRAAGAATCPLFLAAARPRGRRAASRTRPRRRRSRRARRCPRAVRLGDEARDDGVDGPASRAPCRRARARGARGRGARPRARSCGRAARAGRGRRRRTRARRRPGGARGTPSRCAARRRPRAMPRGWRDRSARSVSSTAVGWCAKSS